MQKQVAFSTAWVFTDAVRLTEQSPMEKPILMADFGVNVLGNGFAVRKDTIASKGDMLLHFMTATVRPYGQGMKESDSAAAVMLEGRPGVNTHKVLERECREMKPFTYTKRTKSLGFGATTKEDWQDTIEIVTKYFGLETLTFSLFVYTN